MPHDVRDQIVDFVRRWSESSEIGIGQFIGWLGVTASKFYSWRERYGRANEHNGTVPRDFWLEDWEKQAIIGFHLNHPLEGYRRVTRATGSPGDRIGGSRDVARVPGPHRPGWNRVGCG